MTQVYSNDGSGGIHQLYNSTLSTGWTQIVVNGTAADGSPLFLFYNSESGAARYVVIDGQGGVSQVASTSYVRGWTHIPAGEISDATTGNTIDAYLFYNANSGAAQFYQLDEPGNITQLSNTTFAKGWSEILWLVFP